MKTKEKADERRKQEPVGIVISGGPVRETQPLIAAYVWGQAPAKERSARKPRAA